MYYTTRVKDLKSAVNKEYLNENFLKKDAKGNYFDLQGNVIKTASLTMKIYMMTMTLSVKNMSMFKTPSKTLPSAIKQIKMMLFLVMAVDRWLEISIWGVILS